VGGELVFATLWFLDHSIPPPGRLATLIVVVLLLAHWRLLVRAAIAQASASAALAACMLLLVALIPLTHLTSLLGLTLDPAVLLAIAALALAVHVEPAARAHQAAWPWNAYIGGILPGAMIYTLVLDSERPSALPSAIISIVGAALAIGVHWRPGLWTARRVL
jgi:hypothetical protein